MKSIELHPWSLLALSAASASSTPSVMEYVAFSAISHGITTSESMLLMAGRCVFTCANSDTVTTVAGVRVAATSCSWA